MNEIEYSEDKRGSLAHISRAVRALTQMPARLPCARCESRAATHLIDASTNPRPACGPCAEAWRAMSREQRQQERAR